MVDITFTLVHDMGWILLLEEGRVINDHFISVPRVIAEFGGVDLSEAEIALVCLL